MFWFLSLVFVGLAFYDLLHPANEVAALMTVPLKKIGTLSRYLYLPIATFGGSWVYFMSERFMLNSHRFSDFLDIVPFVATTMGLTAFINVIAIFQDELTLNIDRHLLRFGVVYNLLAILIVYFKVPGLIAQNTMLVFAILMPVYFIMFIFITTIGASDFRLLWMFLPLFLLVAPSQFFTALVVGHLLLVALFHFVVQRIIHKSKTMPVPLATGIGISGLFLPLILLLFV